VPAKTFVPSLQDTRHSCPSGRSFPRSSWAVVWWIERYAVIRPRKEIRSTGGQASDNGVRQPAFTEVQLLSVVRGKKDSLLSAREEIRPTGHQEIHTCFQQPEFDPSTCPLFVERKEPAEVTCKNIHPLPARDQTSALGPELTEDQLASVIGGKYETLLYQNPR